MESVSSGHAIKIRCLPYKKDWIRKQSKGRRDGLGDRILAPLAVLPLSFWNKRLTSTVPLAALAVLPQSFWNKWLSSTVPLAVLAVLPQSFWNKRLSLSVCFKKGKTASVALIMSPNLTRWPLSCLLIKSFFYDSVQSCILVYNKSACIRSTGSVIKKLSHCCTINIHWFTYSTGCHCSLAM